MSYLKSDAMLFTKHIAISPGSEDSNEIMCTLAAQEASKVREVKIMGEKMQAQSSIHLFYLVKIGQTSMIFISNEA